MVFRVPNAECVESLPPPNITPNLAVISLILYIYSTMSLTHLIITHIVVQENGLGKFFCSCLEQRP